MAYNVTPKQLEFIHSIEDKCHCKFIGITKQDASEFLDSFAGNKPTLKQLRFITQIEHELDVSKFTGSTKSEASDYITAHVDEFSRVVNDKYDNDLPPTARQMDLILTIHDMLGYSFSGNKREASEFITKYIFELREAEQRRGELPQIDKVQNDADIEAFEALLREN